MQKRFAGARVGCCRMCGAEGPLDLGHIIPAFVYRWLKDSSATGFLRDGLTPNLRVQDGWRRYWFCRRCEDAMSRVERLFADNLFPLVVGDAPVPYAHGPWLSRFLASVVLRVLMLYSEQDDAFEFFTAEQRALVPQALEHWRAFVHGAADTPGSHDLHFLPTGVLAHYDGKFNLPPNFNRYLLLSTEMHVASNTAQAFVYAKMGPALVFGLIQPPPADQWVGTRVALGDGHVGGKMGLSVSVLEYLIDRAEKMHMASKQWSARQEEKIAQTMRANPQRTAASKTLRAIVADVEMFGADRVFPEEPYRKT
jgi:hypothetical protein